MPDNTYLTHMQGEEGALEVSIDLPVQCTRGIAFLAHPLTTVGGSKDHKVITSLSSALTQAGYIAVRPNFRGAGNSEGTFTGGIGEFDDFLKVIDQTFELRGINELLPAGGRVLFGGFSFGAYVATLACERRKPAAMILAGAPVAKYPVLMPEVPTFLVHGEHDDVSSVSDVLHWAEDTDTPVTVIAGADHVFNRKIRVLTKVFSRFIALI